MDPVILSRLQFAFTIGFHILWPTLTIGLACFITCLSAIWWRTGQTVYRDLLRFWTRLFGMGFAMGVITGIVLSYQIGTNWAGYSRSVGYVLGPLFMYEVLTAFFLEAGFIGIMLFGEGRVSRGLHFFACLMVAMGSLLSSVWIIAANSWMQTPAGAAVDADGIFRAVDWWAVVFSPSFPYRVMHMVGASLLTVSIAVAGISAFHLWQGRHPEAARKGFSMAMWVALVMAPVQIVLGDTQGLNTKLFQPIKIAAMEGLWDTTRGAPMVLLAWPDMEAQTNRFAVSIPRLASLYLTHSWNGEVQGLKSVTQADQPYVPLVFFAFRIMVGVGLTLLAIAITGAVLRWRGHLYDTPWFQKVAMAATPLGFVAVLAGWTVTEAGRQPFVVYGHLRTVDAVSPISAGAVTSTLLLFFIVYNVLLLAFIWFAAATVLRGPAASRRAVQSPKPGLDRAAPAVTGARPADPYIGPLPSPGE